MSNVIESRYQGDRVMRRRYCTRCPEKWVTYEITREEYKKLHALDNKRNEIKQLAEMIWYMKAYEVTPEQMEIQRLNSVIRDLRSIIHELQKDNNKQKSLISKLKSKENS